MRKFAAIVCTALAVATPISAQTEAAALVISLQGEVTLMRGGSAPTTAAVGQQMYVGDVVRPAAGARAILITRTGAQQVVTSETTIEEPRGSGNADLFARAVATLAQAATTDASAGGRQGMIRPIPGASSLVGPRNSLAVSSQRPTFTWTATPGQFYEVMLRKLNGGRPEIFEVGTDTTWTLPEDAPALDAGAEYAWTVFVGGRRGGRPLPQQEFEVISLVQNAEMQGYLEDISIFGLDPLGDGLFLTAVAFRDMELFYDAREALETVERQTELSPELYMLLGEILTELGHEESARHAFDRADELMR